jgi:DNA-binding SARP family transcriptional activator
MASTPAARHAGPWTLRLLGAVEARCGERVITRWPSRAAAALMARLAMAPQQAHAREALVELLWPGVAHDVGRNRLRQVLSTLRELLAPATSCRRIRCRPPGACACTRSRCAATP